MDDFKLQVRYHALCALAEDMLKRNLLSLNEYYRILQRLSRRYLRGGIPPDED